MKRAKNTREIHKKPVGKALKGVRK
jgi:hypothetical protein